MRHSTPLIGMIAALAIMSTSASAQATGPDANDGPLESFFGAIGSGTVWVLDLVTQPPSDRVATQRLQDRAHQPIRYSRTKGVLYGH
ncbi:MAG: hypothetical protein AAFX76_02950 [Planctomycetota bacterium]